MRKPRDNSHPRMHCQSSFDAGGNRIWVLGWSISVSRARRMATWLLKAADWLEEKEGEN